MINACSAFSFTAQRIEDPGQINTVPPFDPRIFTPTKNAGTNGKRAKIPAISNRALRPNHEPGKGKTDIEGNVRWSWKNMLFQRLHVVKAGGKLDDNPEFIQWLQYAMKYRDK
ncbi:hypothetical protein GQ600_3335 [Phytophthora cactorum]|nr:hypothetical protein GQ600_3335 [Phytophthora cactorum]